MDDKEKKLWNRRNKLFFDTDILSKQNPIEANKSIFIFIIIILVFLAAYLSSFYFGFI